ncbi:unnamed protein product [Rotaria socialis]|uniref:Uncharacterized protein n=2 Tax=Rotaria socialis TaxID=392032 RepID=A0A818PXV0_9BILA|nr:unnamed protein product [Rotaria socialis]CAF3632444.1 unnamed protein product [Rotaria socialis]CAF4591104.1 unnamed protein product [Rotaria socialis]
MFRKLKKLIGIDTLTTHDQTSNRKRDEVPPACFEYGPLPQTFFGAANMAREDDGYDDIPSFAQKSQFKNKKNLRDEAFDENFVKLNQSRSKSHERPFSRAARDGSCEHFHDDLPGTPIKFRRRNLSHDLLQPRSSIPFYHQQHSLPGSPEMVRHFQYRQQLEDMIRQQQQQQQQQDMMMGQPMQFYPQIQQQPFYPMMHPNANTHGWFMMPQQRQQPIYPFF